MQKSLSLLSVSDNALYHHSLALTTASPAAHFPAFTKLPPPYLTTSESTNNLQKPADSHTRRIQPDASGSRNKPLV